MDVAHLAARGSGVLTVGSVFSGIGLLDYGLHLAVQIGQIAGAHIMSMEAQLCA